MSERDSGQSEAPSAAAASDTAEGLIAARGPALVREIQQGKAALPSSSLFSLALGGLRVRLMRSIVTMVSVVLAIAFLTYTGLANRTTLNLAQAVRQIEQAEDSDTESEGKGSQINELRTLLRYAGVNIEATLRGNPLDTWLIVMALLTCAVGIANAMLMSVTE